MFFPFFIPSGVAIPANEIHKFELWLSVVGVLSFIGAIGGMVWQRLTLAPCTEYAYGTTCDWEYTLVAGMFSALGVWFFCGGVTLLFFALRKLYRTITANT